MRLHPELFSFLETFGLEHFFLSSTIPCFYAIFFNVRTVNLVIMQREFKTEN